MAPTYIAPKINGLTPYCSLKLKNHSDIVEKNSIWKFWFDLMVNSMDSNSLLYHISFTFEIVNDE